jgi:hypothetical protein
LHTSTNFPIFTGDDLADFVAYLDAHGVPRQRCFRNACRRWADRSEKSI